MAYTTYASDKFYIGNGAQSTQQYGGVAVASDFHWYYQSSKMNRVSNVNGALSASVSFTLPTVGVRFPITCAGFDERVFFAQPDGIYEVINARGNMSFQKVFSGWGISASEAFSNNAVKFLSGDETYIYLIEKSNNRFHRLRVSDFTLVDTISCTGVGFTNAYQETGTVACDGRYFYPITTYNYGDTLSTFSIVDKKTGQTVDSAYQMMIGFRGPTRSMINNMSFSIRPFSTGKRFAVNTSGNQSWGAFLVNDVNPSIVQPNAPTTLSLPKSSYKVGDNPAFDWADVPLPVQGSGILLDSDKVYYEFQLWNGTTWLGLVTGIAESTLNTYIIPSMVDTNGAKFRVRSYLLFSGQKIYSENWTESGTFQVYNNTAPTAPNGLTISAPSGSMQKPLSKITGTFNPATDVDNDPLTYSVEIWVGQSYLSDIVKGVSAVNGVIPFESILPNKALTDVYFVAYGSDGRDFGPAITSDKFNVSEPDPNSKVPNAVILDGINDFVQINNRVIPATGDFTYELFIKTTDARYQEILDFVSDIGTLFSFHITHEGKLELWFSDSTVIKSNVSFNDGILHHVAVRRTGNTFEILGDGVVVATIVKPFDLTNANKTVIGKNGGLDADYFNGLISLPRFWNDVRTNQELIDNKNKIVPDSEQGLIDYFIFDSATGKLVGKKNPTWIGTMYGGIGWGYTFIPMVEFVLPNPTDFQSKGNVDTIRTKVNEFRKSNGLAELNWTDLTLVPKQTLIRAVHWNEIEDGILEVYTKLGQPLVVEVALKQLQETILPHDPKYPIQALGNRIENIIRALYNK